jgi:hypothetical protein
VKKPSQSRPEMVPRAAHNYAVLFSAMRQLVREICGAGLTVIETQQFLGISLGVSGDECQRTLGAIMRDSRTHNLLGKRQICRISDSLRSTSKIVSVLTEQQERLDSLGKKFCDHVGEVDRALGLSFSRTLLRHCANVLVPTIAGTMGWRLFCTWLVRHRPSMAADCCGGEAQYLAAKQLHRHGYLKLLLSSLYGKMGQS